MIEAGFTFEHPETRTRILVLESDAETSGMSWFLEVTHYSILQTDVSEHLHMTWTETSEIISGTAKYGLDGIEKIAKAGETLVVEPRQLHVHPWSATEEPPLVYRQRSRFAHASPAAVQDILGIFATRAGMAHAGKVPANGLDKLLQQAVTVRTMTRHGTYASTPSMVVQNALGSTLGLVAELLGYKAVHPEYVGD